MVKLYRILYCSRNCILGPPPAVEGEVRNILAKSRHNNLQDAVTGGLLFNTGCFAQVLEGPLKAVEAAFERIQCDERHDDVTVLRHGRIDARDFPDWSMAFTASDRTIHPLAGITLSAAFKGQSAAADEVLNLLRQLVTREDAWMTSGT